MGLRLRHCSRPDGIGVRRVGDLPSASASAEGVTVDYRIGRSELLSRGQSPHDATWAVLPDIGRKPQPLVQHLITVGCQRAGLGSKRLIQVTDPQELYVLGMEVV
jgi:hypothetical protein